MHPCPLLQVVEEMLPSRASKPVGGSSKGMVLAAFAKLLALDGQGRHRDPTKLFVALDEDENGQLSATEFARLAGKAAALSRTCKLDSIIVRFGGMR